MFAVSNEALFPIRPGNTRSMGHVEVRSCSFNYDKIIEIIF